MRVALIVSVAAIALVGCASRRQAGRAEQCADVMLRHAPEQRTTLPKAVAHDYVMRAYCRRFAANGWVHPDGAMSIDAQEWLVHGARCATSTTGGKTTTIPCETVENGTLDCAMLRYVRRSEARAYIAELERRGPVSCDDGTALAKLGVP